MISLTVIAILLALGWLVRALWKAAARALAAPALAAVDGQQAAR